MPEYKAIAMSRGTDPAHMILQRAAMLHRLDRLPRRLDDHTRRIDAFSVLCWAQLIGVR